MKSTLLHKVLILSSLACLAMTPLMQPSKKVVKQVEAAFDLDSIVFNPVVIDNDIAINFDLKEDTIYKLSANDNIIGYAIIDKAPSKTAQFDYLIVTDTELSIIRTRVLTYREEYGAAIGSYRWLKQFIGKTPQSEFHDIAAISGATISVRSMKKAIVESLKNLNQLKSKKIIP